MARGSQPAESTNPPAASLTQPLLAVGRWLQGAGYRFTTPTPASHAIVLRRAHLVEPTLRDVFGWNRPFSRGLLPSHIEQALTTHGLVEDDEDGKLRARVRFSTLQNRLLAHDGYPTEEADAVFFGPDTYRFARLIESELHRQPLPGSARVLDVGCGTGAGGLVAAALTPSSQLVLTDINARALQFAKANCALANTEPTFAHGDLYAPVEGDFDLIVANPPYLNDAAERTYRHGGGSFGEALSHRIVREGLSRLRPGGRLILYTGAAICGTHDPIVDPLRAELAASGMGWSYAELDPDVFGEELALPGYDGVERIAAVGLVVQNTRR